MWLSLVVGAKFRATVSMPEAAQVMEEGGGNELPERAMACRI